MEMILIYSEQFWYVYTVAVFAYVSAWPAELQTEGVAVWVFYGSVCSTLCRPLPGYGCM